ncbi:DUF3565 domain-containing protein [Candidatus Mycalebacterium sp.]
MERPVTAFNLDDKGDWVASLSCGHSLHVRHNPPFQNRRWVETQKGREEKIGAMLDCVRCDRFEIPKDFVPYFKSPVFTHDTVPDGLKKGHSTKAGVWAKIVVKTGRLKYHIPVAGAEVELSEKSPGVVAPEVIHHVELLGTVSFFVEFYRFDKKSAASGAK